MTVSRSNNNNNNNNDNRRPRRRGGRNGRSLPRELRRNIRRHMPANNQGQAIREMFHHLVRQPSIATIRNGDVYVTDESYRDFYEGFAEHYLAHQSQWRVELENRNAEVPIEVPDEIPNANAEIPNANVEVPNVEVPNANEEEPNQGEQP
ncbi:expressed unknown protein [Seminavis robusta]|uniref:Uncharacterized protein n=1 Tax=Seminavis robusta TaxID=568900 RepID=A0A9N8EAZ1_9STRA|nr:expressed unknown protein [Seminavis robusta]|eukprot:Sro861_g212260.1 n/a (150) ;mRNA; f:24000-24686